MWVNRKSTDAFGNPMTSDGKFFGFGPEFISYTFWSDLYTVCHGKLCDWISHQIKKKNQPPTRVQEDSQGTNYQKGTIISKFDANINTSQAEWTLEMIL